ncbi:phosphatase PAP2 family protein [Leifsonia xyli]|uniref:phosphatase PAP2 family protein n=1 Tax=Leifsonia xyli TaxID=1575 RepID=UPI0005C6DB75|nr:phosphatase PAP2 family protein [Leifsonia xyli]
MPRPSVESARLRVPAHWIVWTTVLFAVTFALGFAAKAVPALRFGDVVVAVNAVSSPALDRVALLADLLDRPTVAAGILAAVFVVLLFVTGWRRALGVCVATGFGWLTTLLVKAVVAEPRPSTAELTHPLHISPATLSYPSGHVVFAVAVVTGLVLACRRTGPAVAVGVVGGAIALVVGWARLYAGVHYPTDIVGGILNGIAGVLLFAGLWNLPFGRRQPRSTAEQ